MNPTEIAEQFEAEHAEAESVQALENDRQEQQRLVDLADDVRETDLLTYTPEDDDDRILCAYLRQHQQIESETQAVKAQMAAMLKALESRLNRLDYIYLPTVQRIVAEKLRGKKRKSLVRPWGTAGYRTQAPNLDIKDEGKLLDVALVTPGMKSLVVYPPPAISKAALNELFEKTGELPDGVELIPETEKFYCK